MVSLAENHARSAPGIAPQNPPPDHRCQNHCRDHDDSRSIWQQEERHRAGRHRPHRQLPLGTDVPELHPERDGNRHTGNQQWRHLDERFRKRVPVAERAGQHRVVDRQRIFTGDQEYSSTQDQGDENRPNRDRCRFPARRLWESLELERCAVNRQRPLSPAHQPSRRRPMRP